MEAFICHDVILLTSSSQQLVCLLLVYDTQWQAMLGSQWLRYRMTALSAL